eukprot:TRINITY_DN7313_c0_g1_i14.p1 TRINITY_DN7313_c0_g1~~TRINITY_DN7313_c0_g1_i14.p1  ORF type:complete len:811 (+),score=183.63 TRINITY_DN7313_c0_g1_i14:473-2905(+)
MNHLQRNLAQAKSELEKKISEGEKKIATLQSTYEEKIKHLQRSVTEKSEEAKKFLQELKISEDMKKSLEEEISMISSEKEELNQKLIFARKVSQEETERLKHALEELQEELDTARATSPVNDPKQWYQRRVRGGERNRNMEDGPIPLIVLNQGNFVLCEQAKKILQSIQGPIAVISVAGLYRTGKSYLLNRLMQRQNGFAIGATINPCTKGIFMWGQPLTQPGTEGTIILVDTEGLGSIQQDQTYDSKIFSLTILLSSFFIYNSMGVIDETALSNLSFIVNLTKHISAKSGSTTECVPNFLWVVRDFSLQLVDEHGDAISSRQYLENALMERPRSEEKNLIRRAIKEFFTHRDCDVLIRPTNDESSLQQIETISETELRPEFLRQMNNIVEKIKSKAAPKTMMHKNLTGSSFVSLMERYVDSINQGVVPVIHDVWTNVSFQENQKAFEVAFREYSTSLSRSFSKSLDLEEMENENGKIRREVLLKFRQSCFGDYEGFLRKLECEMEERFLNAKTDNIQRSTVACTNLFDSLYKTLVWNGLNTNRFGRVVDLFGAWEKLVGEYQEQTRGVRKYEVLSKLMLEKLRESVLMFFNQIHTHHQEDLEKRRQVETELRKDISVLKDEKHQKELIVTRATIEIERLTNQITLTNDNHQQEINKLQSQVQNLEQEMEKYLQLQEIEIRLRDQIFELTKKLKESTDFADDLANRYRGSQLESQKTTTSLQQLEAQLLEHVTLRHVHEEKIQLLQQNLVEEKSKLEKLKFEEKKKTRYLAARTRGRDPRPTKEPGGRKNKIRKKKFGGEKKIRGRAKRT